jgi:serine/threonine-protein kinase RsbW
VAEQVLTELKIPAHADYIPVAKRVASSLGSKLGFSLEELDELCIALTQACDSAIEASEDAWGQGGTLKLTYGATEKGIEVEVEAHAPESRALTARRRAHVRQLEELEVRRVAQEMIRLFVDDFRSQVDASHGQVRFRMVKYLIG